MAVTTLQPVGLSEALLVCLRPREAGVVVKLAMWCFAAAIAVQARG